MARQPLNWGRTKVEGIEEVRQMFEDCKKAFTPGDIQKALMPAARIIRDDAKRRVAIGRGYMKAGEVRHLQDQIFATKGKPGVPDVIAGIDLKKAPHAHLVEFGTKPHWIEAQPGKTLKFLGKILRRAVHHPGAKKKPFLRPAVNSTRGRVLESIQKGLIELLIQKVRPVYGPGSATMPGEGL